LEISKEQGERFHQDIEIHKEMERRYQGRWDKHMMALLLTVEEKIYDEGQKRV